MYTRVCQSRVKHGFKTVVCSASNHAVSSSSKASHPYPYFFPTTPIHPKASPKPLSTCSICTNQNSTLKSYQHTESSASSLIPDLDLCYQSRVPHLISAQPGFQCQDLLLPRARKLTHGHGAHKGSFKGRNNHFSQPHYSEKAPAHHIIYTALEQKPSARPDFYLTPLLP